MLGRVSHLPHEEAAGVSTELLHGQGCGALVAPDVVGPLHSRHPTRPAPAVGCAIDDAGARPGRPTRAQLLAAFGPDYLSIESLFDFCHVPPTALDQIGQHELVGLGSKVDFAVDDQALSPAHFEHHGVRHAVDAHEQGGRSALARLRTGPCCVDPWAFRIRPAKCMGPDPAAFERGRDRAPRSAEAQRAA